MPINMVGAAHGTKRCPDPSCVGHKAREMSVRLSTHSFTQRVGAGPITIARVEKEPIVVEERHRLCEYCGAENEIVGLRTTENGIPRMDWPAPRDETVRQADVDEQLPGPPPPTLEERVEALEREVRRLMVRRGG